LTGPVGNTTSVWAASHTQHCRRSGRRTRSSAVAVDLTSLPPTSHPVPESSIGHHSQSRRGRPGQTGASNVHST
jgi:hypothetical protein